MSPRQKTKIWLTEVTDQKVSVESLTLSIFAVEQAVHGWALPERRPILYYSNSNNENANV